MLRKIRIFLATVFFLGITLLFLDVTGALHLYLGWMAKMQFLQAVLACNIVIVVGLLLLTLIFGRVYCSVICPLGVMQDCFSWMGGKVWKHRFHYAKAHNWLRYIVLAVFVVLMLLGMNAVAALVAPYAAFGRIASSLLQSVYVLINNCLATVAARFESYAFYDVEVWMKSGVALLVAALTFVLIGLLSFRWGRLWCNTICPVGSVLGLVSRFSLFKPVIDTDKCKGCGKCGRNCKAMCIDMEHHQVDTSRCVACMDCLKNCKEGAIKYRFVGWKKTGEKECDSSRRKFVAATAAMVTGLAVSAQERKVDGGLAVIENKQVPSRKQALKPAGAKSAKHFAQHCTSCQLCVSECPNQVLRPSTSLQTFLQPEMSFERGYCRPECTRCSEVCPSGAIVPITMADKSAESIGYAVVVKQNCLSAKGESCGNCAAKCPAGAIKMVADIATGHRIPSVNENRCIGCGKCEYLCPVRPFSAIYVEGREVHVQV